MADEDPKWEVVDSIPGEKRKPKRRTSILTSKTLWIGTGIGLGVAIFAPFVYAKLLTMLRSPASLVLILLALAYFYFGSKRRRR